MPLAPWKSQRGVTSVLSRWLASSIVKPCLCTDETLPGSGGAYGDMPALAGGIRGALASRGIERLYSHQKQAIDAALGGRHVIVATPTASGKSLCFHVPVLEALSRDPEARAMYLFPTKALARDQEAGLRELMSAAGLDAGAVVYDGDTPGRARAGARHLDQPRHAPYRHSPPPRELGANAAKPEVHRGRRDPHVPRRLRLPRRQCAPSHDADRTLPRLESAHPRGHRDHRQPAGARGASLRSRRERGRARGRERRAPWPAP